MNRYRVMPYNTFGVVLYAVEDSNGVILHYCDTRQDAQNYCNEYNR